MFVSNGTTIFVAPVHQKTQQQIEQQQLAKKRQQQNNRRLNLLIKQTKDQMIFSQILLKCSKHLKSWRERKLILTKTMVGTFKVKKDKVEATEWILLKTVTSCVSPVLENNDPEGMFLLSFYGEDKNQTKLNFRFACKTKEQRDNWIKLIKANAPNCAK